MGTTFKETPCLLINISILFKVKDAMLLDPEQLLEKGQTTRLQCLYRNKILREAREIKSGMTSNRNILVETRNNFLMRSLPDAFNKWKIQQQNNRLQLAILRIQSVPATIEKKSAQFYENTNYQSFELFTPLFLAISWFSIHKM